MKGAAAAECHQRQITWILAALDRHCPDCARHVDIRNLSNFMFRIFNGESKLAGDMVFHCPTRKACIHGERSTCQGMWVKEAQDHIGVGHCRVRGAAAIAGRTWIASGARSEEHTSELQSLRHLVCRLLLEKK